MLKAVLSLLTLYFFLKTACFVGELAGLSLAFAQQSENPNWIAVYFLFYLFINFILFLFFIFFAGGSAYNFSPDAVKVQSVPTDAPDCWKHSMYFLWI